MIALFLLTVIGLTPSKVLAAEATKESDSSQNNVDFSVRAIQPESQVDSNISFFYPAIEPNQKQELQLEITNLSEEVLELDVDITNATTGINGNIDYNQTNATFDESLDYPLSDIVKLTTNTVKLDKKETKIITVEVSPKTEPFPGVKLGSIRVLKHTDKKNKNGIVTDYGYMIGILLTEDKRGFNVGGDLVYKKAAPKIINGRKTAAITLQNPKPYVIQNLKIAANLYKDGEKEVYGKKSLENMSVAPNSSFVYPIDLGLKNLEPGKYRVEIEASNDQDSWNWTKEFTVSQKEADQANKDAAYKLTLPKQYYYLAILLLVLTLLTGVLQIILSVKNKKTHRKRGQHNEE